MERGKFIGAALGASLLAGCAATEKPVIANTEVTALQLKHQSMGLAVEKCLSENGLKRLMIFSRNPRGIGAICWDQDKYREGKKKADSKPLFNPKDGIDING